MKKKLILILLLFSFFMLSACGKSQNAEITKKLTSSISKIEKNISKIEEPDQSDFLSPELLAFSYVQASFLHNSVKNMKDDEFVNAKSSNQYNNINSDNNVINNETSKADNTKIYDSDALSENQTDFLNQKRNVNTYFENRLPRNVNTYFLPPHMTYGYGGAGYGYGGAGYGGYSGYGGYGGFGNNFDNQNPAINQGVYNSTNRRQPNINTYGQSTNNINTYKNGQKENKAITQQQTFDNNTQINLNKLSAIYSSASHLVNVNSDVADIKDRISYVISTLKESVKKLEKSKYQLTSQQVKTIEILIENINSYISKIELSKNQLRYEINKIKGIKDDFLNNNSELSARYIMLANFLDTRYSYYSNISNCLQEILIKISSQIEEGIFDNYNTENLSDNFENSLTENKENVVTKNNEVLLKEATFEKEKTLEKQLEESWAENYDRQQQKNAFNKQLKQTEFETNLATEDENKQDSCKNTNNLAEQKSLIDGFKNNLTEKKEVGTENIITTNTFFLPNLNVSIDEKNEIENLFPSQFPFTKPKKYDYLSIL